MIRLMSFCTQPTVAANSAVLAPMKVMKASAPAGGSSAGENRAIMTGGYRWAPDSQSLVYIPAPSSLPTDELWYYRLGDNSRTPLVTAQQVSFFVAGNDWELAPQGDAIVYRSAIDGAIYTLRFRP